jgi:flagellar protein FliL
MKQIEKVLAIIAAVLLVVIATGTVYGVMSGSRARKLALQGAPLPAGAGMFDGVGRVRVTTADNPPAVVVVDVVFPFEGSDRQFREELQQKRNELRSAASAFFSSRKADELRPANEATIKAALRDTLNGVLRLGRIEDIYFPEFQVID